jgi:hypothetical protein
MSGDPSKATELHTAAPNGVDGLAKKTLLSLGLPVERLRYSGTADSYITFQVISGGETDFADDDATAFDHSYRMDIYSKSDYTGIVHRAIRVLKAAGFDEISINAEIYEHDTAYYHIPIDFHYKEEY